MSEQGAFFRSDQVDQRPMRHALLWRLAMRQEVFLRCQTWWCKRYGSKKTHDLKNHTG